MKAFGFPVMRRLTVTAAVAVAGLALAGVAPASPAAADGSAAPAAHPAIAPASARTATTAGTHASAQAVCAFITTGDNVHRSGGDVSGHGWWVNINCSAGTRATVKIWLEEYYSDGSWRVKASGSKSPVYSGGGSANRAAARKTCQSFGTASWRSRVDVDLIGAADTAEQAITPVRDLACVVN